MHIVCLPSNHLWSIQSSEATQVQTHIREAKSQWNPHRASTYQPQGLNTRRSPMCNIMRTAAQPDIILSLSSVQDDITVYTIYSLCLVCLQAAPFILAHRANTAPGADPEARLHP